jgi:hypothetical protein
MGGIFRSGLLTRDKGDILANQVHPTDTVVGCKLPPG